MTNAILAAAPRTPVKPTDEPRTYDFPGVGEIVRTRLYAPTAGKRFELRLTDAQLDRWRAIAADRDVSVADMVRAAMDFAASHMPADYIEQARAEVMQRALAELLPPKPEDKCDE